MARAWKPAIICMAVAAARVTWADNLCNGRQDAGECARILSNLGSLYYSQARYSEAEPLFVGAIALWERVSQADLAITLHDLAALYRAEARYRESIQLYKRALRIRESLYGSNAPILLPVLNGLAAVYLERGNYSRSRQVNQRARSIADSNHLECSADYAVALTNLGSLLIAQHKYSQAECLLRQAQDIDRDRFPEIGNVNAALAEVYRREGRWEESVTLYREALEVLERNWGSQNPRLLGTLDSYSAVLRAREDYAEAARIDALAMKIRVTQALHGSR
jgi:tetratricopeptide (TPR) repeat protein